MTKKPGRKAKLKLKKKAVAKLSDQSLANVPGGTGTYTVACEPVETEPCISNDDCGGTYRFCWATNHNQALRLRQGG